MSELSQPLIKNLFAAMSHKGSEENEYVMKAIMRALALLQEKTIPFIETVVTELTSKLMLVAKVIRRCCVLYELNLSSDIRNKCKLYYFRTRASHISTIIYSSPYAFVSETRVKITRTMSPSLRPTCSLLSPRFSSKTSLVGILL